LHFCSVYGKIAIENRKGIITMNELAKHITDENAGISYTLVGDYYLPDLALPEEEHFEIGIYGRMRKNYLKNHRRVFYANLLTSGELNKHLHEIDVAAYNFMELVSKQMAKQEGVTEQLKTEYQMLWIGKMENIRNRVMEMIREEIIYS